MDYDDGPDAAELVRAWEPGRTGFPIVDAGMRQLLGEAYVHNRVRMIVASFLVKDLHQEWTRGARYFLHHLVDGDLASNNHGWQWVAGTGTDASPYYRVFNPVTQGKKFDPDGAYVKRLGARAARRRPAVRARAVDGARRRARGLSGADRRPRPRAPGRPRPLPAPPRPPLTRTFCTEVRSARAGLSVQKVRVGSGGRCPRRRGPRGGAGLVPGLVGDGGGDRRA